MDLVTKFDIGDTFYTCFYDNSLSSYQIKPNTVKKIEIVHNESNQNVVSYVPVSQQGVLQASVQEVNCLTWDEAKQELDTLNKS